MANDFLKYKDKGGAVTLTKKGGKYDAGDDPKFDNKEVNELFRGISGDSKAATILSRSKQGQDPNFTAKVMRDVTSKKKSENDAAFFKHTEKNK